MITYIRPLGLMPAYRTAVDANRQDSGAEAVFTGALPLCGDGPFDFTAIEIIQRQAGAVSRRAISLSELWGGDLLATLPGMTPGDLAGLLEQLTSARPRILGLSPDRPLIMGIVNVTPDSFSDGGKLASVEAAIAHGLALAAAGADILDVGGESTRPGSDPVALVEELARVEPVIAGLAAATDRPISIDTRKAVVMRRALAAGASLVNDVSGLTHDPEALTVIADAGVPVVLMHALADPKVMQLDPVYADVTTEVFDWLRARIAICVQGGIRRDRIVADPGIGFGKTLAHNLQLLSELAMLHGLGVPILLGASRKSFIGRLTGETVAERRLIGSVAVALAGAAQGVQMLRVHDVAETRAALAVWQAATFGKSPLA